MDAAPQSTSDSSAPAAAAQGTPSSELSADDVKQNKDVAALSYVWVLSVFVYFSKRSSPFVAFHAKQGMVLFVLSLLVWFIPFGIGRIAELLVLVGCVVGFLGAAQGEWKQLPIVGAIARRDKSGVREEWKGIVDSTAVAWNGFRASMEKNKGAQQPSDSSGDAPQPPAPLFPPAS